MVVRVAAMLASFCDEPSSGTTIAASATMTATTTSSSNRVNPHLRIAFKGGRSAAPPSQGRQECRPSKNKNGFAAFAANHSRHCFNNPSGAALLLIVIAHFVREQIAVSAHHFLQLRAAAVGVRFEDRQEAVVILSVVGVRVRRALLQHVADRRVDRAEAHYDQFVSRRN